MRCLAAALVFFAAATSAQAGSPAAVDASSGSLPVILTAPHGGADSLPGCGERSPAGPRFVNRPDAHTERLTRLIAGELKAITGHAPYLVIARFHRKYIDANRHPGEAYGDPGCAAAYAAYHAAIRAYLDEIRGKYRHAMLFDIHGQSVYRDAVLRGTRYGSTVQALLARAGAAAINGPDSVFGRFAALGYRIVPNLDSAPTDRVETKNYIGGHTVEIYGSHHSDGIDAMQLEFGLDLRGNDAIEATARASAQAIAAFYGRFLK